MAALSICFMMMPHGCIINWILAMSYISSLSVIYSRLKIYAECAFNIAAHTLFYRLQAGIRNA